jgi:integrase
MSVEKVERADGVAWRVRWRDDQGRPHSRVVGRKRDAQNLDVELKRAKRLGATATVQNSRETLEEFSKVWWNRHAAPNLQQHTLASYASTLDVHIVPRLGGVRLQAMTPDLIAELHAAMKSEGSGDSVIRKTLALLQNILERAVEWRRLDSNPARGIRKPSDRRNRVVRPLTPETIERMRAHLLGRGQYLDATLVAVLAYAGLRPGEAIGLGWNDVGERTLLVERAVAFGQLKSTKTGKARTVRLLPPLTETLATWRRISPRPAATDLLFPSPDGSPWNGDRVRNWRKRAFAEAAAAAGVPGARPYDLRHSFVSLLIAQGASVVEVARQAGHTPTMTLDTYAHLFDELADAPNTSAEDLIRAARAQEGVREVSVLCPRPTADPDAYPEDPCKSEKPSWGLEPRTPSLPWNFEALTPAEQSS